MFLPEATSHSMIVLSRLPVARVLPSGLNATDATPCACPVSVAVILPLATSHSLTVLSRLAEASVLPSGLNVTERTESVCLSHKFSCDCPWAWLCFGLEVSSSVFSGLLSLGSAAVTFFR